MIALTMDPLEWLPPEITSKIFSSLDVISLCQCQVVSSAWKKNIDDSQNVWKSMCHQYCDSHDVQHDARHGIFSWKEIFIRNYKPARIKKWLAGEFSNLTCKRMPCKVMHAGIDHMTPMSSETWGQILEAELAR